MKDFKYSLIVFQCYHSCHKFIVKFDENFIKNAKKVVNSVKKYKNIENNYLGDLEYYAPDTIHKRYNYNGHEEGDIYIINANTINELIIEIYKYIELELTLGKKFKNNKKVMEYLYTYHDYFELKKIVTKYLELA